MPSMFDNCHDFTINNGNFMNIKGDFNKIDNSRTHYTIDSNNTYSTVHSNSFNDQSREYGSHCKPVAFALVAPAEFNTILDANPNIYQGPVNNIRHADNVNTGANHGKNRTVFPHCVNL